MCYHVASQLMSTPLPIGRMHRDHLNVPMKATFVVVIELVMLQCHGRIRWCFSTPPTCFQSVVTVGVMVQGHVPLRVVSMDCAEDDV